MNDQNLLRGLFLAIIAGVFGVMATRYFVGTFAHAGPGLFPLLVSCLLGVIAVFMVVRSRIVPKVPVDFSIRNIGIIMVATVGGMAVGGWASGFIFDLTGSYRMAFIHGIAWNIVNMAIMVFILLQSRPAKPHRTSGSGLATSAG